MALRRPSDLPAGCPPVQHCPLGEFPEVQPLLALCQKGRLYEVEQWIEEGRPIQFAPSDDRKILRLSTPLQISISRGFHSLAALLLANGYNPNGDHYECLGPAVAARDHDMVDLLLKFGANPNFVDFADVLETCDRALMDRFIAAGVDPCKGNATARALETGRRPILGFVKQYLARFPGLQRQVDISLRVATSQEQLKKVCLLVWLGGNPHAIVPDSSDVDPRGEPHLETAFEDAMWAQESKIADVFLKRPIPEERLNTLLPRAAFRAKPAVVHRLLELGANPNAIVEGEHPVLYDFITSLLWRVAPPTPAESAAQFEALELMLKAGAKCPLDEKHVKWLRRHLADAQSKTVIRLLDLLRQHSAMSEEMLHELTRTPAVKRVLSGYSKPNRFGFVAYEPPPAPLPVESPPPRRGYWRRHWSQR